MAEAKARNETGGTSLSASSAAAHAVERVDDLIAGKPVAVTSVEPVEDGWLVEVEVLEEQRIPSSADRLALYEVELDPGGELLAYRRSRQYARGRAGGANGAMT